MAKHIVKCYYCGKEFDASQEEFVMPFTRRYAHAVCFNASKGQKNEKDILFDYILKLYGEDKKNFLLAAKFCKDNNYSYSGILGTLKYFHEIKRMPIDKAKGIAIVPYVYEEAKRYYESLAKTQSVNINKNLEDYAPKQVKISISEPKVRAPYKITKKFEFLDKDGE